MLSRVLCGVLHAIAPHFHVIMKAVMSSVVLWTRAVLDIEKAISCAEAEVGGGSRTAI